ncbi:acetyl-CoA carboxylase biotin carboxyl carrier protein [Faecalispora anaeroviscerum]|uniref:acetyl-CoA carboxylase biotin carboxyl carrier protein n=1 Tax=Faecalispora anaeroviscerum TaxID=2991836 RepID=UPI0024BA15C2|nr:acetyl-CoA carboxylase biotin carboxyl carrier protein subunit [Faecalispora anaeroviscerum]
MIQYQEKAEQNTRLAEQPAGHWLQVPEAIELMREFEKSSVQEFRLSDGGGREICLKKHGATESAGAQADVPPDSAKELEECSGTKEEECIVTSPLVGVFYTSVSPDQPPLVSPGQIVKKGDPLFIIEAMKMMNEIASERDGVITEVLAQNEQAVEFGQPVLRMK